VKVKIASVQMDCQLGNVRANLEKIRKLALSLSRYEPDFVCFPELATTGYSLNQRWRKYAEEIPGESSEELSTIARELGCYLICGIDELDSETDKIYDSSLMISPDGNVRGTYRKVHLWENERKYFSHGPDFPVFNSKFGIVGMGICYDIEFPETSRLLATKGASILFFPSAEMSPYEKYVETYAMSRACENMSFVVFSNRIGKEGKTRFFGRSQIVSPECKVLANADGARPFAQAEIDLTILQKLRSRVPYLSQLVPEAYVARESRFRAEKALLQ
jgi:predicted amidohydrolase